MVQSVYLLYLYIVFTMFTNKDLCISYWGHM